MRIAVPAGSIYYASLAGNHITCIDRSTGTAKIIEPPTPRQGARRVWSDSQGRIWMSDFGANALVKFDLVVMRKNNQ
jgi:virginiamycin B lyase